MEPRGFSIQAHLLAATPWVPENRDRLLDVAIEGLSRLCKLRACDLLLLSDDQRVLTHARKLHWLRSDNQAYIVAPNVSWPLRRDVLAAPAVKASGLYMVQDDNAPGINDEARPNWRGKVNFSHPLSVIGGDRKMAVFSAAYPHSRSHLIAPMIKKNIPYFEIVASMLATLRRFDGEGDALSVASVLSQREVQVLRLYARDQQLKTMADELGISVSTVSTHLRRIREKTGIISRESLVSFSKRL